MRISAAATTHRSTTLGTFAFFIGEIFHDGEDKKRDDPDGAGSTQPSGREEAIQSVGLEWKHGVGGPGKFPTQWPPKPTTNLRLAARESWGYPHEREIRNRQFVRPTPRYLVHRDILLRKQEENEHVRRSFSRLRY